MKSFWSRLVPQAARLPERSIHCSLWLLVWWLAAPGGAHAQPAPPSVATLPAGAVGTTNATLNGLGNPNGELTSGFFQWGTTTNYGSVTPAQSLGNVSLGQALDGLLTGGTYHFRAVASNGFYVVAGTNQSFTTPVFMDINAGLPALYRGALAWGDYDNDGRLDITLMGTTVADTNGYTTGYITGGWRNYSANAVGYHVETAPSLLDPVIWTPVNAPVEQVNGQFRMLVDPAETERYFHLRAP